MSASDPFGEPLPQTPIVTSGGRMSTGTPTTNRLTNNTLTLVISAAVALVVIVGLVILVALKDLTWGDAGPLIGALAGVHGGASLAAFVPK